MAVPDPYQTYVSGIVAICLLVSAANVMLAARSISAGAAMAFALGFLLTGLTWALALLMPQVDALPSASLLLLNTTGALGMIGLWCGFWLRAGRAINWWFMGALFAIWILPVVAILMAGLPADTHVPFAVGSVTAGVLTSVWFMYRKRGQKNAGDWALIAWLLVALPLSVSALLIGMDTAITEPNAVWLFYLGFLPTLFTGVGLFALLGFTLDAIRDSDQLARTDGLTGLLNRRAFDDELAIAVARTERYQRDLSLIILDIDHFKQLNDTYGHPAGDAVIRAVSRVLLDKSRRIDLVARIGGEEFAMILADTPASAALRLAERLRQAISNASSETIAFSASLGVASVQDTETRPEALLEAADNALYAAKKAGRNCVRYSLEPDREPSALIGLVQSSRQPS